MRNLVRLAALVGGLTWANSAWAIPDFMITDGVDASQASESSFVASLGSYTQENFNALPQSTAPSVSSAVGTFTSTTPGQQGQIISIASGDISGRGLVPFTGNFVESRDSVGVSWVATLGGALFDAIGFYIQDAGDQGALLNLKANDGSGATSVTVQGANGNTKYVVVTFDHLVSQVAFDFVNTGANIAADGWGLDNVTIGRLLGSGGGDAPIPEPASLMTLASGLLGLGVLLRRRPV
jgi:PEP-CTERM motif